jgi:cytochrome c
VAPTTAAAVERLYLDRIAALLEKHEVAWEHRSAIGPTDRRCGQGRAGVRAPDRWTLSTRCASRSFLTWFKDDNGSFNRRYRQGLRAAGDGRHRDPLDVEPREIHMKTLLLAAALGIAVAPGWAVTPEEAMTKAGCMACHSKDKKIVGPAFKDIAAKYKGQNVTAKLMEKVRKGGSGSFGPVPMTPNPPSKIDDANLKAAVEYVLRS